MHAAVLAKIVSLADITAGAAGAHVMQSRIVTMSVPSTCQLTVARSIGQDQA